MLKNHKINWVIGYPLIHTKSPLLHNAIYKKLNISAYCQAYESDDIAQVIKKIKENSIELTAVTMPFKEKILKYVDDLSEEVKILGAANTIIQCKKKLYAYNTDVTGIEHALINIALNNKAVLVIGAGGAARALGYVLKKHNARIFWLNRTPEHAKKISAVFGGTVIDYHEIAYIDPDIIVNTTPLGMHPKIDATPLIDYSFKSTHIVFDMVYNPVETLLLCKAKEAGATIISGLEMFIGQALKQIELWQNLPEFSLGGDARVIQLNLKNLFTAPVHPINV